MENIEKKTPLNDLMDTTMDKIRDMVDSNTIIGEPITTPDGVTVIPVSRVSFGFGAGGGDYGKTDTACLILCRKCSTACRISWTRREKRKISTDFGHNRGIPNEGVIPCRVLPDAYLPFSLLFPACQAV